MRSPGRLTLIAGAVAVALLGGGCGTTGNSSPAPQQSPTATSMAAGSGSYGGGQSSAAPNSGDLVEINVTVSQKKVSPPSSVHKVKVGSRVRISVKTDDADELHLHGYDKMLEVPPGKPTTLEFVADRTGMFEAELHEADVQLFQIEVTS